MEKEIKIKMGENDVKKADIEMLNRLMKQLNPESPAVNMKKIKEVMASGIILTLRDASKKNILIGIGTLIPIRKLFVFCGTIEDVVVDEAYRGQGLGKKIMRDLIKKSASSGMKFVDLTSRSERITANKLYQSIGFEKRKTNLYRLYN